MKPYWYEWALDKSLTNYTQLSDMEQHCITSYFKGESFARVAKNGDTPLELILTHFLEGLITIIKSMRRRTRDLYDPGTMVARHRHVMEKLEDLRKPHRKHLNRIIRINKMVIGFDITDSLQDAGFSEKAEELLRVLNISNTIRLRKLAAETLKYIESNDVETVEEIITKAREIGIKIE